MRELKLIEIRSSITLLRFAFLMALGGIGELTAETRYVEFSDDANSPGRLRYELANASSGPTTVTIKANVTQINLAWFELLENVEGDLVINTEGQRCKILDQAFTLNALQGSTVSMYNLEFNRTAQITNSRSVVAVACHFKGQGPSTSVGGLGHFVTSTSGWPNPSADSNTTLTICTANSTTEDGVQVFHAIPSNVIVNVLLCDFNNNYDDGFEVEDFKSELPNSPIGEGDIRGSIGLCDSVNNHNGFNINEGFDGNLNVSVWGCETNTSRDSGIEMKERGKGSNDGIISGFTSDFSISEGVLMKESDEGAVGVTLIGVDASHSLSHGAQVVESGSGTVLTNRVDFDNVDAYTNWGHGFEIQTDNSIHSLDVNPGGGGNGSLFNSNWKSGFKVDNDSFGPSNISIDDAQATGNLGWGVYLRQHVADTHLWLSDSTISTVRMRADNWFASAGLNTCDLDEAGSYGTLLLFPDPELVDPGADPVQNNYTNWSLSDTAHDIVQ